MRILSFGAEWALVDTPGTQLRATAGVRRWQMDTDINVSAGALPARSVSGSNDWWDGIVGFRGRQDIGDQTRLTGWSLVGGGGSEIMAGLFGGVGYRFSEKASIIDSCRYPTVGRTDGSFAYHVDQKGLNLGLKFSI